MKKYLFNLLFVLLFEPIVNIFYIIIGIFFYIISLKNSYYIIYTKKVIKLIMLYNIKFVFLY